MSKRRDPTVSTQSVARSRIGTGEAARFRDRVAMTERPIRITFAEMRDMRVVAARDETPPSIADFIADHTRPSRVR